jgi:DNA-binding MarR family transcriptional regulator
MQSLLAEMTRMTGLSVLFSHALAARIGLNPTDLEALEILMREGPLPAGRLAESTGLTTGAITGVVDRLERKGFARRRPDPDDRRRVIIEVEQATVSRDLLPLYAGMQQAVSALIAGLDDRDLALFLRFIQDANAIADDQIAHLRAQAVPDIPPR